MHPPMGGVYVQIINLQTELNYLNYIKIYSIFSNDLTPPIDPLNHSSIKPPMHLPMGGGVCTNHKSSNRIELSQLGQDLLSC